MPTPSKKSPPGVIRPEELYTIREFMARAGIGDYTYRRFRDAGFSPIAIGKKRYVLGKTFIDFVTTHGERDEKVADT